jgi:hypothetical protein
MKKTRKLASLFLAVVMVLSMSTTVFADQAATVVSPDTTEIATPAATTSGAAIKTTTDAAVKATTDAAVKATTDAAVKATTDAAVKATTDAAVKAKKATAAPTTATVLVNGTEVAFEAYNIDGNNYFKLRDLAQAVNGSAKQFAVNFDQSKNAISLVSNTAYTAVGGELAAGDGKSKEANPTTSTILKDNAAVALTAYNINNNNYFKLRDVAKAFNIGVTYDNATKTVGIDTAITYTEEATTTTDATVTK